MCCVKSQIYYICVGIMGFVVGNLQHGVDRVDMGKDRIGAYDFVVGGF